MYDLLKEAANMVMLLRRKTAMGVFFCAYQAAGDTADIYLRKLFPTQI